jgi:23S rRNA (cytidine1920-2'-O)/16S rRNA (cytidine1409-2'-O)-methyltransferase
MKQTTKKRLDILVHERLPQYSRQQIQSWIMQGKVLIEGHPVLKAGTLVPETTQFVVHTHEPAYVSRAGFKLEKIMDELCICVDGLTVLDAGLSTGGFTDCLLQKGAAKVYGVDVGYGQVHEKIRYDKRVVVMERTNLRNLTSVGVPIDLITLDLSFISVLKVMHAVTSLLKYQGHLIVLIKPQFEAQKHQVGRGGIIKDPLIHQEVTQRVIAGIVESGFECLALIDSPLLGADGNKEFLAYFVHKKS